MVALRLEYRNTWVLAIQRAVNLLGDRIFLFGAHLFNSVDVHDRDDRVAIDVRIAQRDARLAFDASDIVGQKCPFLEVNPRFEPMCVYVSAESAVPIAERRPWSRGSAMRDNLSNAANALTKVS